MGKWKKCILIEKAQFLIYYELFLTSSSSQKSMKKYTLYIYIRFIKTIIENNILFDFL